MMEKSSSVETDRRFQNKTQTEFSLVFSLSVWQQVSHSDALQLVYDESRSVLGSDVFLKLLMFNAGGSFFFQPQFLLFTDYNIQAWGESKCTLFPLCTAKTQNTNKCFCLVKIKSSVLLKSYLLVFSNFKCNKIFTL